jgi:GMP synthase (glutamine-hydrolysing)
LLLVVDNGSVYTKNLIEILERKKISFKTLIPSQLQDSSWTNYSHFILSGRKKNDRKMNQLNSQIIKHAVAEDKPLLGICYGAEILALTLGGTIRKMNSLKKGMQKIQIEKENPLCSGIISVYESHSYEISNLNQNLSIIGGSDECKYEIIKKDNQNIFGTQFHPEMSEDGEKIIESFCNL